MTTLQLEYFLHLSQTLHLTRTAEHFYVSPPAIAASIKRLENELSVTLFVSQGRSLLLTESGKIDRSEKIVSIITGSALRDLPLFDTGAEAPTVDPSNEQDMQKAIEFYRG